MAPTTRRSATARSPGRPTGGNNMRDEILDVAERLFAAVGYEGAAQRVIASEAGVNQALINYHFGSKEGLYEAVVKRRGFEIVKAWEQALDTLEARTDPPPTVRELVSAYIGPQFALKRLGPSTVAFLQVQARLHNEPGEMFLRIRREIYDLVTKRYIRAMERALPDVDKSDVNWRVIFMIGTFLYMLPGMDRLDDLSDGHFSAQDVDEIVERLTVFLTAGMEAPSTDISRARRRPRGRAPAARKPRGVAG